MDGALFVGKAVVGAVEVTRAVVGTAVDCLAVVGRSVVEEIVVSTAVIGTAVDGMVVVC